MTCATGTGAGLPGIDPSTPAGFVWPPAGRIKRNWCSSCGWVARVVGGRVLILGDHSPADSALEREDSRRGGGTTIRFTVGEAAPE